MLGGERQLDFVRAAALAHVTVSWRTILGVSCPADAQLDLPSERELVPAGASAAVYCAATGPPPGARGSRARRSRRVRAASGSRRTCARRRCGASRSSAAGSPPTSAHSQHSSWGSTRSSARTAPACAGSPPPTGQRARARTIDPEPRAAGKRLGRHPEHLGVIVTVSFSAGLPVLGLLLAIARTWKPSCARWCPGGRLRKANSVRALAPPRNSRAEPPLRTATPRFPKLIMSASGSSQAVVSSTTLGSSSLSKQTTSGGQLVRRRRSPARALSGSAPAGRATAAGRARCQPRHPSGWVRRSASSAGHRARLG